MKKLIAVLCIVPTVAILTLTGCSSSPTSSSSTENGAESPMMVAMGGIPSNGPQGEPNNAN